MTLQGWQKLRRVMLFLLAAVSFGVLLVGHSVWASEHWVHEALENFGVVMIIVCIIGRTWCSLYIGGRKKSQLVDIGPYSIMRNPLYTFSFLGAFGVGLQFGAVTTGLLAFAIAYGVFSYIVMREEAFLKTQFGESYQAYLARVPRFFPKVSLWQSPDQIEVYPNRVWRTFFDALVFLVSIPLLEFVEQWQDAGVIPVLFYLY